MAQTDSTVFETASEAVLFCQAYLLEKGERTAAIYLEGLDCVCDPRSARIAHGRLVAAEQRTTGREARYAVISALRAVERALDLPALQAAS